MRNTGSDTVSLGPPEERPAGTEYNPAMFPSTTAQTIPPMSMSNTTTKRSTFAPGTTSPYPMEVNLRRGGP